MEGKRFSLDPNEIPIPNFDVDKVENSLSRHQNYNYITPDKLACYISDPTCHPYDFIVILDARFEYEHKGGKIMGALNITSLSSMIKVFQKYMDEIENGKSICIVIHCEYSSIRGPKLYDLFREYDRNIHISEYPKLSYPNLFLLEGGYKKFFNLHPELCRGQYISMYDNNFVRNNEIKRCQKLYFYDYKENIGIIKSNSSSKGKSSNDYNNIILKDYDHSLKLNFKQNPFQDHYDKNDIQENHMESQPRTVTYSKDSSFKLIQLF
ncbi:m-phase inducer phosphatase [Tritrichomonas musculus]|uniref:protein-tyrosine-phosphatase n=1 Tax=Tritrichomonas musculus TaxID=1915356 RepID=A0ABR2HVC3_9EUKA